MGADYVRLSLAINPDKDPALAAWVLRQRVAGVKDTDLLQLALYEYSARHSGIVIPPSLNPNKLHAEIKAAREEISRLRQDIAERTFAAPLDLGPGGNDSQHIADSLADAGVWDGGFTSD